MNYLSLGYIYHNDQWYDKQGVPVSAASAAISSSGSLFKPAVGDVLTMNPPAGRVGSAYSMQINKGAGLVALVTGQTYTLQAADLPTQGNTWYIVGYVTVPDLGQLVTQEFWLPNPAVLPAAPTVGVAVADVSKVTSSFTLPANNGGSPILSADAFLLNHRGEIVSFAANITSPFSFTAATGVVNGRHYKMAFRVNTAIGPSPLSAFTNLVQPNNTASPSNSYLGIVATRNALPNAFTSTGAIKYMQNKVAKTATEDMPQVEMWFTNISPVGAAEIPGGIGTMAGTIDSASIEHNGTFTRATFNGSQVGTFVGGPQILKCIAPVFIPKGAQYFEWTLTTWTSTYCPTFNDGMNNDKNPQANISGEKCQTSPTPLTDLTMTGTGMTNTAYLGTSYRASAHVGVTTSDSYALFTDSKGRAGLSWDSNLDAKGFKGEVGRGLEKRAAMMNLGVNGDSYTNVTTDGAYLIRAQFAALCNKGIDCLGANDLGQNGTVSKAQFETFIGLFQQKINWGAKPYLKATLTPRSTTTDGGMTTVNQTTVPSNVSRVALNDALRAGTVAGVTGYVELADAVETARNSGILVVPAGSRVITDAQAFGSNGMNSTVTNWTAADIGKLVIGPNGGAAVITNLQTPVLARASSNWGTFGPDATVFVGIPAFGPPGSDLLHLAPAMELLIANSSAFDFAGPVVR